MSIKKPFKAKDIKTTRLNDSEFTEEWMEEEDATPASKKTSTVTNDKVKEINLLKRRFALGQRELLHFVNHLEFFVGYSVYLLDR